MVLLIGSLVRNNAQTPIQFKAYISCRKKTKSSTHSGASTISPSLLLDKFSHSNCAIPGTGNSANKAGGPVTRLHGRSMGVVG